MINDEEVIIINPQDLEFTFELHKHSSCSFSLENKTINYVAFKVKTTSPKKYLVRPNVGIAQPNSITHIKVTMLAQNKFPEDTNCRDKFLVVVVKAKGADMKNSKQVLFNEDSEHVVKPRKLKVTYHFPPQPPSPVPEGSEEGSSPRGSVTDSGKTNGIDFALAANPCAGKYDLQNKSVQLVNQKSYRTHSSGEFSLFFVALIGLLGLILGYLAKSCKE